MTSVGGSIVNILGGSCIDTTSLVTQLVGATRAPREQVIQSRTSTNNARISGLASATNALDTFSNALAETLKSSAYAGQPVSNDPTIVGVSTLAGGVPAGLPAQIEVVQLATAQTLESLNLATAATAVGQGTLTLTTASGAHTITIDATNDSLAGLASAINGSGAGVTASVVVDNRGARLVLKGATGLANAFTLTKEVSDTADANLQRFTFDGTTGGMSKMQSAGDSIVRIDNVEMRNNSNTLDTAIPFLRIDLNKAAPGTLVTLATNQPTSSVKDLVKEFVTAYNTLRTALNSATATGTDASTAGVLSGDPAVRDMKTQLSRLTTTMLASSGPYRNLSDIGVSTNRDGTLKLDDARLTAALAADPAAVTQMINPAVSTAGNPGLAAVVKNVKDTLESTNGSLATAKAKYTKLATDLSKQLEKLNSDMTDYEAQLTTTYTKMQSRLSAFKATQSYLEQQVAAWNNSKN